MNIIRKLLGLVPRLKRRDLKQCYIHENMGKDWLDDTMSYKEHRRIHKHFKQNDKGYNRL